MCMHAGAAIGVCDVLGMAAAAGTEVGMLTPVSWRTHVSSCMSKLKQAYEAAGYVFVPIIPFEKHE